jgi:hypothetical protein
MFRFDWVCDGVSCGLLSSSQGCLPPNQQQAPPPPPQSRLGEFLRTHLNSFSQAKDPMDAEDWLKSIEKKLEIALCSDREKVLFIAHQLFRTTVDWWKTYYNTHPNVETINKNEFKARFRTHYVPYGTLKLKKKVFSDLNQGSMTVNEYLNQFIQLSRYATDVAIPMRRSRTCFSRVSMMTSSCSCSTSTTQIWSTWLIRPSSSRIS